MHHDHHPTDEKINYSKRFLLGILLNITLVAAEIFYGIQSNSVALVSDGFHNAGDVLGLIIAWGGFHISSLKPSERFTYGLKNTTIIAAFINAVLLFIAVGGIGWEAIIRIGQPEAIHSNTVIIVACAGVLVNGFTAIMFLSGRRDINIRGAFLHMASDAAVSLGVIIGSVVILYTNWVWIDPALCIGISVLIVISSWSLFRESINLILHAVPEHIDTEQVRNYLLSLNSVMSVHDLHIWAISTSETALSAHLVRSSQDKENELLQTIAHQLQAKFQINHSTIQVENQKEAQACEVSCNIIDISK